MSIWPKQWASNLVDVPGGIVVDDLRFPTVEHAFQASKTLSTLERRKVAQQPTPQRPSRWVGG